MLSEQETTAVDVITHCHRYRGLVPNRGYRVADILSDSRTDILEMRDTLTSTLGTGCPEMRFGQLLLKKNSIVMVLLTGKHEAPVRRGNNYVKKDRYGALIVLPGYILSGVLHLPSHASASMLLVENSTLPSFLGMTDVGVHGAVHDVLPSPCKVVLIRRQFIESAQLSPEPLPDQPRKQVLARDG